jgi:hypothetical protein
MIRRIVVWQALCYGMNDRGFVDFCASDVFEIIRTKHAQFYQEALDECTDRDDCEGQVYADVIRILKVIEKYKYIHPDHLGESHICSPTQFSINPKWHRCIAGFEYNPDKIPDFLK